MKISKFEAFENQLTGLWFPHFVMIQTCAYL